MYYTIVSGDEAATYTADYRRSAFVVPSTLLALVLFMALSAWAITAITDNANLLLVIAAGAGGTILFIIGALLTGLRVHYWRIEGGGLRIEERPKVPFTGTVTRIFAPWPEVAAVRRIESAFERQIEIEMRDGSSYRMAQGLVLRQDATGYVADHAGMDGLAAAISARLAVAEATISHVRQGLSFWNRLPGLAILCAVFVASVLIAALAAAAFWSGAYLYGAVLKGAAIMLVLPGGAGYLLFKSVKRRRRVLAITHAPNFTKDAS
jgi:hypothetical protein